MFFPIYIRLFEQNNPPCAYFAPKSSKSKNLQFYENVTEMWTMFTSNINKIDRVTKKTPYHSRLIPEEVLLKWFSYEEYCRPVVSLSPVYLRWDNNNNADNTLVASYDIHRKKREVLLLFLSWTPHIISIWMSPLLGHRPFYELHIKRTGHNPPRGPSAGWRVGYTTPD
jgi:hypothetical protein